MGRRQEKEWQLGTAGPPSPHDLSEVLHRNGVRRRQGREAKEKSRVGGVCPQAQPGGKLLAPG